MKKWIYIILFTFCLGIAVPIGATAKEGAPAAVLPETHYRFGTAIEGETVQHDFTLINKGTADLRIEKIKTD
jgi:hypothetical protein